MSTLPLAGARRDADRVRLMRRVALAMLGLAAVACLAGVPLSTGRSAQAAQAGVAAAYAAFGVLLLATRPRARVIEGVALAGIVLLSALIALAEPLGMTPYYFLWPIAFLAYFSSTRLLAAGFVLLCATFAPALALNPTAQDRVDMFTGTLICVGVIAVLTVLLNRREAALRERLAQAADTDALTGLLNRRAFDPQLAAQVAQAVRRGTPVSVVMFDLDHFKAFNDTHGHMAGDEALRVMGQVLREASRAGDLVCRFGGEEFAVALPDADAASARAYADRVGRALCVRPVPDAAPLTTSAGVATLCGDAATAEELVARADRALYVAKAAGRRRTAWWEEGIRVGDPVECAEPVA